MQAIYDWARNSNSRRDNRPIGTRGVERLRAGPSKRIREWTANTTHTARTIWAVSRQPSQESQCCSNATVSEFTNNRLTTSKM